MPTLKCPHCLVTVSIDYGETLDFVDDKDGSWWIRYGNCCACARAVIFLINGISDPIGRRQMKEWMVWPRRSLRPPVPKEVPESLAEDYNEACRVLADSPKASAALSRRCLQNLLREAAKVKHSDLASEIQQVLDSKQLPSHLADAIDAVRNIGNFAAHPIKSQQTGQIVDVEPGEADWLLDVLESLFDFYFVQPEVLRKKREALNQKLAEAGKPPMKSGT